MKTKLNLTIEKELIKFIKHTAIEQDVSVSNLIEAYIKAIRKNKNVIQAIQDINK